MNKPQKLCVCFAGVPGCGKSQLAVRISWEFGLPLFSNDTIRNEIRGENKGRLDIAAYKERKSQYLKKLVSLCRSLVYDSSVDREWDEFESALNANGYTKFLISFDLSTDYLQQMGGGFHSGVSDEALEIYLGQHQKFLDQYSEAVDFRITDTNYAERFDLCLAALRSIITSS